MRPFWATTTIQLDPDVLAHHAKGDGAAYVVHVDVDAILREAACPVMLLSGEPQLGGVMSQEDAEYARARLKLAFHVAIENVGHDLSLSSSNVEPFLAAVNGFLGSLQHLEGWAGAKRRSRWGYLRLSLRARDIVETVDYEEEAMNRLLRDVIRESTS